MQRPEFGGLEIEDDGLDIEGFERKIDMLIRRNIPVKFIYRRVKINGSKYLWEIKSMQLKVERGFTAMCGVITAIIICIREMVKQPA
jgi:hypothetical protein